MLYISKHVWWLLCLFLELYWRLTFSMVPASFRHLEYNPVASEEAWPQRAINISSPLSRKREKINLQYHVKSKILHHQYIRECNSLHWSPAWIMKKERDNFLQGFSLAHGINLFEENSTILHESNESMLSQSFHKSQHCVAARLKPASASWLWVWVFGVCI